MIPAYPKTPFDMARNRGKTVWAILPHGYASSSPVAQSLTKALAPYGIHVKVFNGQGQVTLWNQGIQTAVTSRADAIFLHGQNPALIRPSLAKAIKAGIPVVGDALGTYGQRFRGVVADATWDWKGDGRTQADFVLAKTGCNINTALFTTTLFPQANFLTQGVKAEFNRLCPATCKLSVVDVDLNTITTQLATQTQSKLATLPDSKWLLSLADIFSTYMAQGIRQSGSNVSIVSHDGISAALDAIRRGGGPLVATISQPPYEYQGWVLADLIGRAMLDLPVYQPEAKLPTQLIDASNIGQSNATAKLFPGLTRYKQSYKELWSGR